MASKFEVLSYLDQHNYATATKIERKTPKLGAFKALKRLKERDLVKKKKLKDKYYPKKRSYYMLTEKAKKRLKFYQSLNPNKKVGFVLNNPYAQEISEKYRRKLRSFKY